MNNIKLNSIIKETYESINELSKLSDDILEYVANTHYNDILKTEKLTGLNGLYLFQINSNKYDQLKNFISRNRIYITFDKTFNNVNKGAYTVYKIDKKKEFNPLLERDLILHYDFNVLKEKIESNVQYFKSNNQKYPLYSLYDTLRNYFKSNLLHELQHAYDDFRSKSMFHNTKQSNAYLNKYMSKINNTYHDYDVEKSDERLISYYNQPHEIWARFSQAIDKINFYDADFVEKDGKLYNKLTMKPFNNVLAQFKVKFLNYGILPDKMKKVLIRRLSAYYYKNVDKVKKLNREEF